MAGPGQVPPCPWFHWTTSDIFFTVGAVNTKVTNTTTNTIRFRDWSFKMILIRLPSLCSPSPDGLILDVRFFLCFVTTSSDYNITTYYNIKLYHAGNIVFFRHPPTPTLQPPTRSQQNIPNVFVVPIIKMSNCWNNHLLDSDFLLPVSPGPAFFHL